MNKIMKTAAMAACILTAVACGNNASRKAAEEVAAEPERKLLTVEQLAGTWNITAIAGNELTEEQCASIVFEGNIFGANAGCNQIGGEVAVVARTADAIRFENTLSTQMLCEDMKLEEALVAAIESVRSFYGLGDDTVAFADEDANIVILATKAE